MIAADTRRLALVGFAGVVVIAVVGWRLGWFEGLSDSEMFQERIRSWGVWGPIAFVVAMWLIQPLGVPGVFFMVPASLVWSTPVAVALSWIGNMGASWLAFEFTRSVGREWVQDRIPPRLRAFDERIEAGGVWPVLVLRVLTGQIPPADWLLGVSSVKRVPFLIGTGIGIIPGLVLIVAFGADLIEWVRDNPLALLPIGALLVARKALTKRKDNL